jgi:hypothetical protein
MILSAPFLRVPDKTFSGIGPDSYTEEAVMLNKTALALTLFVLHVPAIAGAQTVSDFLNAPTLYVNLDVSLDAKRSDPRKDGVITTEMTLHRTYSGLVTLDLRSPGSVITMLTRITKDPKDVPGVQEMMTSMSKIANWMEGAPEVGDDLKAMQKHMQDISLPYTLHYQRVDTGTNMQGEMGGLFNSTLKITVDGDARAYIGNTVKLEINTIQNKILMMVPYAVGEADEKQHVTETRESTIGTEVTRSTSDFGLDLFPSDLTLDTSEIPNSPIIHGDLKVVGGKLTGQESLPMHFKDQNQSWPATMTVKYAVTLTKPKG